MKRSRLVVLGILALLAAGCETTSGRGAIGAGGDVSRPAELQTQLGIGYLREGQYELALQRLRKALDLDPRYSVAHNAMALLHERLGELETAEEHYRLATRHNPADSSAQTNYGNFLCRQGRVDEAEKAYRQALANPLYESPEIAHSNAGLCLKRAGRIEEAEAHLRRALERNPRIPAALLAMAELSFEQGEELSARAYMQRYVEVGEHSPETLWLGVRIERALGDLDAAASYAMLLKSKYPDSSQARELAEAEAQWQ